MNTSRDWAETAWRLLLRPFSDEIYLKVAHRRFFGRGPDFERPTHLHEHIHRYVLRERNPQLVMLADKVRVRDYIAERVGSHYAVPLLAQWERADQVPLETLPFPVVLKPSHASGRVLMLRSAADVRPVEHRRLLRKWLAQDYSRVNREWFYHLIPHRIIAEPMLRDAQGGIPADCKAYVIGGRVRYFQVECDRFARPTRNLYSPHWQLLPVRGSYPRHAPQPPPPELAPSCAEGGVLGVLPGIIGSLQANEAIKLGVGIGDSLVGRLLLFDALAPSFTEVKLRRDPACPVCGESPTI
ncbi:MAG TPA: ATP-grasp fold amidoligase family protein, partial [Burkholderiaceae bacterium]|nr:ATP-grasp fold amidoligase family protein [Burkholderiaceae bacterium]